MSVLLFYKMNNIIFTVSINTYIEQKMNIKAEINISIFNNIGDNFLPITEEIFDITIQNKNSENRNAKIKIMEPNIPVTEVPHIQ